MLVAHNLHKQYKNRKILTGVNLQLPKGKVVGLLGPNGAGKTTCFYMLLGLIKPDNGTIWLQEQEISSLPINERAKLGIGYLPQENSIFRKLSVEENIMSILELNVCDDPNTKLENLLHEFNLQHIRHEIGISLSGGERRRVEIARCLAASPKFILLDEPFAGVDPISIVDLKAIIHLMAFKGIGILITDHNVRDTLDICETAYILSGGQVICSGSPSEIVSNSLVKEVYLGENFTF